MFANQTEATNKWGKTQEARDDIITRYRVHIVDEMLSKASFYPTFNTMKRLAKDFTDFAESKEQVELEGIAKWERLGIAMTKDGNGSSSMFGIMTRNKAGFRQEKEPEKDNTPVKIEIVGITSRDEANKYRAETTQN